MWCGGQGRSGAGSALHGRWRNFRVVRPHRPGLPAAAQPTAPSPLLPMTPMRRALHQLSRCWGSTSRTAGPPRYVNIPWRRPPPCPRGDARTPSPQLSIHQLDLLTFRRLQRPFTPGGPGEAAERDDFPSHSKPVDAHTVVSVQPLPLQPDELTAPDVRDMYRAVAEEQAFGRAVRCGDANDPGDGLFRPPPPIVRHSLWMPFAQLVARVMRGGSGGGGGAAVVYPPHVGDPVAPDRVTVEFDGGARPATQRVKPLICKPHEVTLGADPVARLGVAVSTVRFADHPLFCREDWLAAGLTSLYETYCRKMRVRVPCVHVYF